MGGLPGLNWHVNYKEYSLYGGSLYRGTTVVITLRLSVIFDLGKMAVNLRPSPLSHTTIGCHTNPV